MLEDITDRIKSQDALVASEKRNQKIIERNPFPMMIFSNNEVEYINPKFTELIGYTIDEIPTGREWSRKAYPDKEYRAKVIQTFKEYAQNPNDPTRGIDPFTFDVTCKNGSVRRIVFQPVEFDPGKQLFMLEDTSARLRPFRKNENSFIFLSNCLNHYVYNATI